MKQTETHRTVLGILFTGLGIFGLIGMVVVVFIFSLGTAIMSLQDAQVPRLITYLPAGFGIFIALIIALTSLPNFVAAYGLLKARSWAPAAALLIGILNIPIFPFGTGVAIYAIWFFFQSEDSSQLSRPGRVEQNR